MNPSSSTAKIINNIIIIHQIKNIKGEKHCSILKTLNNYIFLENESKNEEQNCLQCDEGKVGDGFSDGGCSVDDFLFLFLFLQQRYFYEFSNEKRCRLSELRL